ncbi:MAG: glycosyltransferase, partial [Bacteroidota bacterium]
LLPHLPTCYISFFPFRRPIFAAKNTSLLIGFMLLLLFVFWISVIGLAHTYLIYPLFLQWLTRGKRYQHPQYESETDDWPLVTVVMSVFNEEQVIAKKLDSLLAQSYPSEQLQIYLGSDCSTDATNKIVKAYAQQHPNLYFFPFQERGGKPGTIDKLMLQLQQAHPPASDHLFLLTDANVMLMPDTLKKMARHFRDPEMALVDSNMKSIDMKAEGISLSENEYISGEVLLKHRESLAWGKMIGPFGGCYLIRSTHYVPVPPRFLVDDFYIAFKAFEKGGKAINDLEAISLEAVSDDIGEEFRRKSRISGGNVQNLLTFAHFLWPPFRAIAFAFFSHKVLRWLGPFFIIFALVSSGILAFWGNKYYASLFELQLLVFVFIPLLEYALAKMNINLNKLRHLRYFIIMNLALLNGFFKYAKGIKTNVWEPTKRKEGSST